MVGTALTIEREVEDARSTRDVSVGSKREDQPSSSSGKWQKTSASTSFRTWARIRHLVSQDRGYVTSADCLGM